MTRDSALASAQSRLSPNLVMGPAGDHEGAQPYDAWREHDLELTNRIVRQVSFQIVALAELWHTNVHTVCCLVRERRDHREEQSRLFEPR